MSVQSTLRKGKRRLRGLLKKSHPTTASTVEDQDSARIDKTIPNFARFEDRAPAAQTAVDVFRDRWACDLGPILGVDGTGPNLLFTQDMRPALAARALGLADLQGLDILEIGPLEAAHTYLMERMGARSITCVESNVEAWLKCLVVKELLKLDRSNFQLGNISRFLEDNQQEFDLVFCSGVLYHMSDPVELINSISRVSKSCFVWTHVYDPLRQPVPFEAEDVERLGVSLKYWRHQYGSKSSGFWGGIDPSAVWLTREDLLRAFTASGLSQIDVIEDQFDHPAGPAIMFTARRPGPETVGLGDHGRNLAS